VTPEIAKTLEEWRKNLAPDTFSVCRLGGTERPFSGRFDKHFEAGVYHCVCCGSPLFRSESKFDSGSGWPNFFQPAGAEALCERVDDSHGMRRVEIRCAACEAHLGHVFPDGKNRPAFAIASTPWRSILFQLRLRTLKDDASS